MCGDYSYTDLTQGCTRLGEAAVSNVTPDPTFSVQIIPEQLMK